MSCLNRLLQTTRKITHAALHPTEGMESITLLELADTVMLLSVVLVTLGFLGRLATATGPAQPLLSIGWVVASLLLVALFLRVLVALLVAFIRH